jgi:hypothetical protein
MNHTRSTTRRHRGRLSWADADALRAAVQSAGFGRWQRLAETPVNVVYEVRQ